VLFLSEEEGVRIAKKKEEETDSLVIGASMTLSARRHDVRAENPRPQKGRKESIFNCYMKIPFFWGGVPLIYTWTEGARE
jgi:hypothetical protein